jgi:hypothetical protein
VTTNRSSARSGGSIADTAQPVLWLDPPGGWGRPMVVAIEMRHGSLYELVLSVLCYVGARLDVGLPTQVVTDDVNHVRTRQCRSVHTY